MKYIWQLEQFPKFKYDATKLLALVEESVVLFMVNANLQA